MGETNFESSSGAAKDKGNNSPLKSANLQWRDFIEDLKRQWKMLWRNRIDDKVRAEGVAREGNPMLFVDEGTVIVATRKYRPPDFGEILNLHRRERGRVEEVGIPVQTWPSSGWGKFIKTVIKSQPRFSLRRRSQSSEEKRKDNLQKKKGGRGWTHRF